MQTKKHTYILVFTEKGPKFVTKINYQDKTAEWKENEKPLDFSKDSTKKYAENVLKGLLLNWLNSCLIYQDYEIDNQPYNYKHFKIKFEEKEEEKKWNI